MINYSGGFTVNRVAQIEKVACEVFSQVRTSIVLKMRFMDLAVFKLKPTPSELRLATDGSFLFYRPTWVLKRYQCEPNAIVRDYMHVMLHCIFRHPFISSSLSRELWDLACDIAVEAIISDFKLQIMTTKDETKKKVALAWLQSRINMLTAEKLYNFFSTNPPNSEWFELFKSDDHDIWHDSSLRALVNMEASHRIDEGNKNNNSDQENNSKNSTTDEVATDEQNNDSSPQLQSNRSDNDTEQQKEVKQNNDISQDSKNSNNFSLDKQSSSEKNSNYNMCDDSATNSPRSSESGEISNSKSSTEHVEDIGSRRNSVPKQSENHDESSSNGSPNGIENEKGSNKSFSAQSVLRREDNTFGYEAGKSRQEYNPSSIRAKSKEELSGEKAYDYFEYKNVISSELESNWKDISERIQIDLESFSRDQGYEAGGLSQMLKIVNKEKYDYETFLRKFAVLGEELKINDDEFDYIFYTYGLKLFANMPLIEPLEYKEVKRIREFVIAIDTSGSTSGDLVNMFLTKTYNILLSTDSFFSKVNLYIIQCDAEIQECVKIQKKEDFLNYIAHMKIKGLGGTDFRPVFRYVDELVKQKQFMNLKGMIYFTDGAGTYPSHKPNYQAAFVFIRDAYYEPEVPPWAIKLVLEKEEL